MLAAQQQTFQQHIMVACGVMIRQSEGLIQPAIDKPDGIAAAAGGFVISNQYQRTLAQRMRQKMGDRPLAAFAADRGRDPVMPPIPRRDAADQLGLS